MAEITDEKVGRVDERVLLRVGRLGDTVPDAVVEPESEKDLVPISVELEETVYVLNELLTKPEELGVADPLLSVENVCVDDRISVLLGLRDIVIFDREIRCDGPVWESVLVKVVDIAWVLVGELLNVLVIDDDSDDEMLPDLCWENVIVSVKESLMVELEVGDIDSVGVSVIDAKGSVSERVTSPEIVGVNDLDAVIGDVFDTVIVPDEENEGENVSLNDSDRVCDALGVRVGVDVGDPFVRENDSETSGVGELLIDVPNDGDSLCVDDVVGVPKDVEVDSDVSCIGDTVSEWFIVVVLEVLRDGELDSVIFCVEDSESDASSVNVDVCERVRGAVHECPVGVPEKVNESEAVNDLDLSIETVMLSDCVDSTLLLEVRDPMVRVNVGVLIDVFVSSFDSETFAVIETGRVTLRDAVSDTVRVTPS